MILAAAFKKKKEEVFEITQQIFLQQNRLRSVFHLGTQPCLGAYQAWTACWLWGCCAKEVWEGGGSLSIILIDLVIRFMISRPANETGNVRMSDFVGFVDVNKNYYLKT